MKKEKIVIASLVIWTFINIVLWTLSSSLDKGRFNDHGYEGSLKAYLYPFNGGLIEGKYYEGLFVRDWDIFRYYDYQEFLAYVIGAWMVFFLYKYLKKT